MLHGTNLPLIILFIIVFEIAVLFNQSIVYLSRTHEKKRLYHLNLLFLLILYNICEGFFPDQRITFVPELFQNFLGHGFGYVFAAYCPVYFYGVMQLEKLRFHGRFGYLVVLIPVLIFYGILYPINRDIAFTRKYVYIVPALYAIVIFTIAIRDSIKSYRINQNRLLLGERMCVFFAVFPVSVTPIFGGWLGMDKWVITTTFNVGFLIVNAIFMKQLIKQSKFEYNQLTVLTSKVESYSASALNIAKATFDTNCLAFSLTKREIEIIELMADGIEYKKIAEMLFISERTVTKHVQNMFIKTGATNKTILFNIIYG
jgi:DNA-binding CsgD family transcriptional regulator